MIIFTVLGIFIAIFFFVVILMSILESRVRNRTKEKFLWNMEKLEPLTEKDLTDEIQDNER